MRQVVLDTETTGIETSQGHRIIEIGCVEVIERKLTGRHYHQYINPQREVDEEAVSVHGLDNTFLADKPIFVDIAQEFYEFIHGAELVIHNAPFDVGFINHEFKMLPQPIPTVDNYCQVLDTLVMAREMHPGQRNSLDALCKRYDIDNSHRELHGALLDAEILATVYLTMTGGQTAFELGSDDVSSGSALTASGQSLGQLDKNRKALSVIKANNDELQTHEAFLDLLDKRSEGAVWRSAEDAGESKTIN